MRTPTRALTVAATILAGAAVLAHVRLVNLGSGSPLYWLDPGAVSFVINAHGSNDLPDGSHDPALRSAADAWNAAGGGVLRLVEDASAASRARTDWGNNDVHLLMFDESNFSGFFPPGSGIVAVTALEFANDGRIIDADVLFNGSGFQFTTSGGFGRFDLQGVAAHEFGHVLGFDHTGWAGATMFPYVSPGVILHRSLSLDERCALRGAYPWAPFATLRGRVLRATGGAPVAGAQVVALDAEGRTAAAALAAGDGRFALEGLDAGTYTVYASPLSQPVGPGLWPGHPIQVDFQSTVFGSFTVASGQTIDVGNVGVDGDVALSLGRAFDRFPLRVVAGETCSYMLSGAGLAPGCSLAASDPEMTLSGLVWGGNWVSFLAHLPPDAPPGHIDLTVVDTLGRRTILTGALEVTPPDPVVGSVSPDVGDPGGGTPTTIAGEGFNPGARVVMGNRIYRDGEPGGCTVVSDTTITLTTAATVAGAQDVVVIDPTGVEGRRVAGFLFTEQPTIATVFPPVGDRLGGTTVVLTGDGFVPGAEITIGGVLQPGVVVHGPHWLSFTTAPSSGGRAVLILWNPGVFQDRAHFDFVAQRDPVITAVAPDSGSFLGGETIVLSGADFTERTRVVFGVDPRTGAGGAVAASVTHVNAGTLRVVTPFSTSPATTVMVREQDTQQAHVVDGAFCFTGFGGRNGGGGCAAVGPAPPPRWRDVVSGAWWIAAALLLLRWHGRRRPATARA